MAEDKATRSARNRRYYVKRMEQAQQPEPPREHVKIGPNALGATGRRAASSERGGPYNPFQPYTPAPGVVPKGHEMAMDAMDQVLTADGARVTPVVPAWMRMTEV